MTKFIRLTRVYKVYIGFIRYNKGLGRFIRFNKGLLGEGRDVFTH